MIDKQLVEPFANAVKAVIGTMCELNVEIGEPRTANSSERFGVITGILGMASPKYVGNLFLKFDESAILLIVSNMLKEEFKSINQDIIDAVGELTNMVVGVAKRDFEKIDLKFDMASPAVAHGSEVHTSEAARKATIIIPCRVSTGAFHIEIAFEETKR